LIELDLFTLDNWELDVHEGDRNGQQVREVFGVIPSLLGLSYRLLSLGAGCFVDAFKIEEGRRTIFLIDLFLFVSRQY